MGEGVVACGGIVFGEIVSGIEKTVRVVQSVVADSDLIDRNPVCPTVGVCTVDVVCDNPCHDDSAFDVVNTCFARKLTPFAHVDSGAVVRLFLKPCAEFDFAENSCV